MSISSVIQVGANLSRDLVVGLTKSLNDDSFPGVVDLFMDQARGRGHRVVFGHDLSYLPEIYDKFGLSGVSGYFKHLSKDVMSTDGVPLPFASQVQEVLELSSLQSINWLCLNVGDVLSGGVSFWHSREVLLVLKKGQFSNGFLVKVVVSSGLKVFISVYSPNPLSLISGLVDLGSLAYFTYPSYSKYFSSEKDRLYIRLRKISSCCLELRQLFSRQTHSGNVVGLDYIPNYSH